MVANYRCTELKDEALAIVKEKVTLLIKSCEKDLVNDFCEKAVQIVGDASQYYSDVAKQYDNLVFRKIQKDLIQ